MSTPVNFNKLRKDRARAERKLRADRNAVAFGRTKSEKEAERKRKDKAARDLDGHRRDR